MSVIKDALTAIREAVKLVDEVKKAAEKINLLAVEIRDLDRRVCRLEGRWEAAFDIAKLNPRLRGSKKDKK